MNLAKRLMVFRIEAGTNVLTWLKEKINEHSKLVYVLFVMLGVGIMATIPDALKAIDSLLNSPVVSAPMQEDRWEEKAPMPTGRAALAACAIGGDIYVMGGCELNKVSNKNEVYHSLNNSWESLKDMLVRQSCLTLSVVNEKIYAIGGFNLNTVAVFNPKTNIWEVISPMPSSKSFHSANVIDGKIFVIGGWEDANVLRPSNSIFKYDPVTDKWEIYDLIEDQFATAEHISFVVGNSIYCFGGINPISFHRYTEVRKYNIANEKWSIEKGNISLRCNPTGQIIGDKIYIIGGEDPFNGWKGFPTVEVYDIKTGIVEKRKDMPIASGYLTSALVGGNKIHVLGGTPAWPNALPDIALNINLLFIPGDSDIGITPQDKTPITWGTLKQLVKKGN